MSVLFADTLGIRITEKPFLEEKILPVFMRNEYEILQGEVENVPFLLLKKTGDLNLAQMKGHMQIVAKNTNMPCAFILDHITDYQKKRLIELHISFIVPGKQLYLPFLGVALHKEYKKIKKPVQLLSFASQKNRIDGFLWEMGVYHCDRDSATYRLLQDDCIEMSG